MQIGYGYGDVGSVVVYTLLPVAILHIWWHTIVNVLQMYFFVDMPECIELIEKLDYDPLLLLHHFIF